MKALSLWQPWASLVVHSSPVHRKEYETRSWACPSWLIGQEVAIHATKTIHRDVRDLFEFDLTDEERGFFDDAFAADGYAGLGDLPLGAVLGTIRIVECLPTVRVNPTTQEATFGDFGPNRFAWRMALLRRFETPIPAKGMQGIWTWDGGCRMIWPKLTETLPIVGSPLNCGSCGTHEGVIVWQECDERDQPTTSRVALCRACSDRLVEPHERLYSAVPRNVPLPGAMATCEGCALRDGLSCKSPLYKLNGGPGLPIRSSAPSVSFIDGRDEKTGRRWGRQVRTYAAPPECDGREPKAVEA